MKILDVPLTGVLTTLLSTSVAGLNLMPSSALAASSNSVQDIVDRAYEAIELQNETSAFGIAFDKPQSMEGGLLESTPNENTYEYQAEWGQITLTFGKADYYGSDDVLFYNDSNFPVDYFTQTNAADGYSYLGYLRYENEPMSFNVHFMLNGSLIEAWTVLASPSPVIMSVICPVNELELALLAIDELYSSVRPAASSIMPDRTSDESNSQSYFGNWAIRYYIDEYGLPTSTGYLDLAGEGSYSRLSLSNEDLTARFIIDDENASVALYTDGTRIIGTQDETYQVSITSNKEEDPVHYEMEAHLAEDGDRFYFSDYETIIYLLATGDTLDFCLENSRQSEEQYSFTMDVTGFSAAFTALYPGITLPTGSPSDAESNIETASKSTDTDEGISSDEDATAAGVWADGTYEGTGRGMGGDVPVTVTIEGGAITEVVVGDNSETQGIGSKAIEQLPGAIVAANGIEGVDGVSGASVTSKAIFTAVEEALASAGSGEATSSDIANAWEINYYVDESGAQTEERYITATGEGAFGKSLMTTDELTAEMIIDEDSCAVALYEYYSDRLMGSYDEVYDVRVRDGNGNSYTMQGYLYDGDDRVYFSDHELILDILTRGGTVRFNLTQSTDRYTFSIDATGFSETYASLFSYADGTYEGTGKGMGGDVPVTVTIEGGVITAVEVGDNSETQGIGSKAIEQLPAEIVAANGTEGVDGVSGASVTSKAISTAVEEALSQAV